MPVLRNVDVFVKARADIRTQSTSGGLITLIAASAAFLLFLGQVYFYAFPSQSHTLHLAESMQFPMLAEDIVDPFQKRRYDIKGKIPLYFKITFLHTPCESLGVTFNGEAVQGQAFSGHSGRTTNNKKTNPTLTVKKYKPRSAELRAIFGSEHSAEARKYQGRGCTLTGNMRVPIVAGNLAITMTRNAWIEALNFFMAQSHIPEGAKDVNLDGFGKGMEFNATHYIHEVRFGKKKSAAGKGLTSSGYVPPLEDRLRTVENDFYGIAKEEIQVKLIPTVHSNPGLLSQMFGGGNKPFYQMSVVEHMLQPETMMTQGSGSVPGVVLTYDVTPLAVHIDELNGDGGFLGFLSSLIGIVGGCFVTVGLFAGCAVRSVEAVAKKID
mmetsp:Transcript_9207/g.22872  ORF Transcript_9207/g.22872 Transcript_9207/m.22872 type:complete len:381 (+) Transcript_9207:164-1306(+)|eukprot:CAMPEP_0116100936 /NCGR_PEP_ID=MMETSP0327-20121206/12545_1 /TAXON_ID=44447 /ORGANISM="Pseudo-nitzschia delicatissima, Strain B596" /LENGTH=380 /DNA_ID=CAMNT_0003592869 /DNA_START=129 /DNA_END=1271 /DNA_ORIENTATION=+